MENIQIENSLFKTCLKRLPNKYENKVKQKLQATDPDSPKRMARAQRLPPLLALRSDGWALNKVSPNLIYSTTIFCQFESSPFDQLRKEANEAFQDKKIDATFFLFLLVSLFIEVVGLFNTQIPPQKDNT